MLADSLARGQAALNLGRRGEAEREFGMSLQLDPENQTALAGMARAEHIEAVFALMAEGEALERDGKLEDARDVYRKVAALDPEITEAPERIQRIDAAIVQRSYTEAMSVGYAALGTGDFTAARKAFRRAARIRPNAAEPAEGLARVAEGERVSGIEGHRIRAVELEKSERWRDAVEEYQAVLAIDPGITFAQQGVQRAGARAELDERLQGFLDSPERLYSKEVLQSAGQAIQRAGAIPKPGPRLVNQATRLAALMEDVTQPVRVLLESDEQTDVVVYRVGRIGTFERFELQLTPGTSTLLGTRQGYRDVRREVTIRPGETAGPFVIRCEERI